RGSSWREGDFSLSLTSGGSLPIGPDEFAGHWNFAVTMATALDYRLDDQWAIGAIVDYGSYSHTGRSLKYRNSEFPCISGGDRQLSSAGMRMKYYMASGGRTEVYLAGTVGVVN